jgi:hypothetical protein
MSKYGIETPHMLFQKSNQISPKSMRIHDHTILGLKGTKPWALLRKKTNSAHYTDLLPNEIQLAIWSKYWGQLSKSSCAVGWRYLFPHCCSHCFNSPATKLRDFNVYHTPMARLSDFFVCMNLSKMLRKLLSCQKPQAEVGGAYVACHSGKHIFFIKAHISLCNTGRVPKIRGTMYQNVAHLGYVSLLSSF